jgi:hypothetical protein
MRWADRVATNVALYCVFLRHHEKLHKSHNRTCEEFLRRVVRIGHFFLASYRDVES